MKITLLLNNDIHSANSLSFLVDILKNHQVKIYLSSKVGNVLDLPDEVVEMKRIESQGVDELYQKSINSLNCEANFIEDINLDENLKLVKDFAPDLIISIRFGQILQDKIIKLPKFGVINLHSGLLPKYRGIMATFWAILNGEKEIGTTLHYIQDSKIDRGDIISYSKNLVNFETSLLENVRNLYQKGCLNISDFLRKIEVNEKVKKISKDSLKDGEYFSYPKKEDVVSFSKLMRLN